MRVHLRGNVIKVRPKPTTKIGRAKRIAGRVALVDGAAIAVLAPFFGLAAAVGAVSLATAAGSASAGLGWTARDSYRDAVTDDEPFILVVSCYFALLALAAACAALFGSLAVLTNA